MTGRRMSHCPKFTSRLPKARLPELQKVSSMHPVTLTQLNSVGETETEPELPELPSNDVDDINDKKQRSDSTYSAMSVESHTPKENVTLPAGRKRSKTVSMHDLTHRFFRNPVIVLSKIDIFR
jgi:phosphatidylethanolamine N-methyltransferase